MSFPWPGVNQPPAIVPISVRLGGLSARHSLICAISRTASIRPLDLQPASHLPQDRGIHLSSVFAKLGIVEPPDSSRRGLALLADLQG